MTKDCFICSMKLIIYFSSLSDTFVKVNCPHSQNTITKPFVRNNVPLRRFGLILYLALASICLYELYVDVTFSKFSLFKILAVSELVSMTIGLVRNFLNVFRLDKMKELQVMLWISEYVRKFSIEDNEYEKRRKFAIFGIASSTIVNSLPMGYFLYDQLSVSTILISLNRFILALLLAARYFQYVYEFSFYRTFLKRAFAQIQRELKERLAMQNRLKIIHDLSLFFPYDDDGFLRRMKKLRKLYMVILSSFRRTKDITNSAMVTVLLAYYLLLSLMLCIVLMGIRGDITLNASHFLYIAKHVSFVVHLVIFAFLCDNIEKLVQENLTALFMVPLNLLNKDESREVELLISLVAWERPIDTGVDFGKHLLAALVVGVVTNCMVLIQLYFWFQTLAAED